MVRLYFICMGNYYRSRLAQELAEYYASHYGLEITTDSGGLSKIPNPNNPGNIARATLDFLANKGVSPKYSDRPPKPCIHSEVYEADIVICTDEGEQRDLFEQRFPDFQGRIVAWNAFDEKYDPHLRTPDLIDRHVEELILELKK